MRAICILALLLATTLAPAPPDPGMRAQWDGPGAATVSWHQTARGCLSVEHRTGERAFISCYEKWPASYVIALGHGLTDATVRPADGDVYVLQTSGQNYRASLRGRDVYLPVCRG